METLSLSCCFPAITVPNLVIPENFFMNELVMSWEISDILTCIRGVISHWTIPYFSMIQTQRENDICDPFYQHGLT